MKRREKEEKKTKTRNRMMSQNQLSERRGWEYIEGRQKQRVETSQTGDYISMGEMCYGSFGERDRVNTGNSWLPEFGFRRGEYNGEGTWTPIGGLPIIFMYPPILHALDSILSAYVCLTCPYPRRIGFYLTCAGLKQWKNTHQGVTERNCIILLSPLYICFCCTDRLWFFYKIKSLKRNSVQAGVSRREKV